MDEMGLFLTSSTRAAGRGSPWNTDTHQYTRGQRNKMVYVTMTGKEERKTAQKCLDMSSGVDVTMHMFSPLTDVIGN